MALQEELHRLYHQAGNPSLANLEKHARLEGYSVSKATFGNLLNGQGKARLETVEAFVVACVRYASSRRPPLRLPLDAVDLAQWRLRYAAIYLPAEVRADAAFAAARRDYVARLQERYGRVDLEILTPLTEQAEHPPVKLQEVFIAQLVRADPPPVELPRELWKRLTETGELDSKDLPSDLNPEMLTEIRQSYQQRPARSVLQVLTAPDQRRLVLLGDPGAGKSTLARYLALTLADTSSEGPLPALVGWLPLLVELRTYADERWRDRTFMDLIDFLHTTEGLGLPKTILDTFLSQDGRAVVIFDGLDEVFDPHLRETVAHQIIGFAARYPDVRIVVTSRVIGYRRAILSAAGFSHYMLQDLDTSQVEAFVTHWYQIACSHNAPEATCLRDRLLGAFDSSAAVRELAGNPMLLTILSIIGRRRDLPRDRRKVYEHAAEVLVEHWDPSKHLRNTRVDQGMSYLDRDDKLELLRLVARRMQDGAAGLAGNHIPGTDLIAEFDSYLRQRYELPPDRAKLAAKAMLNQFRERNFILSRFGGEVYGFVHRTFLEYFTAADIVDRLAERDLTEEQLISEVFGRRWPHPAWQEVLLLITGMIKERFAGQVIDHLLAANPQWFLHPNDVPRHALLAVRCIGEVRKLGILSTQSVAITDTVTALLETAAEREDLDLYDSSLTRAIEQTVLPVFAALGPHWAGRDRYQDWYLLRGQFLATSGRRVTDVLSLAARLGAALLADSPEFRELLKAQAIIGPHRALRSAAARALTTGWRDDPNTLSWLRELATTTQDWDVPSVAQVIPLLRLDHPDTDPLLRKRVTGDKYRDARWLALRALTASWRDDPDTLSRLRQLATTAPAKLVRETAVQALAAGWGDDPNTLSWLRELATTDQHWTVRWAAVHALGMGWRDDPGVLSWLRELAITAPAEDMREAAVQALAAGWRDDPNTGVLLRELATADLAEAVRRTAVQALASGWGDDPNTLSWLRELATTDQHRDVRWAAVHALGIGWRDDPDVLSWLRELATTDQHRDVRWAAVQALAGLA